MKSETYSPKIFKYDGFTIEGTLYFDDHRSVFLKLTKKVGRHNPIYSMSNTTVQALRKEREIEISILLKSIFPELTYKDLSIYKALHDGLRSVTGEIIHKSLEPIAHLQIPSQPVPSL